MLDECQLEARINDDAGCISWLQQHSQADVDYHPLIIDYHQHYLHYGTETACGFKLLLTINNQSCGILPLMIRNYASDISAITIGANSGSCLPPLLEPTLSRKQKRKLYKKCLDFITRLHLYFGINILTSQFPFFAGVSEPWFALLTENGGQSEFNQELYCDLSLSDAVYLTQIRDKYRSHIKRAAKLWRVEIKTTLDDQELAAFQALHLSVAGKKTRSDQSWQLQQQAVNAGAAFMVYAYDDEDKLIGAALFNCTHYMASYAVGAYDRDLFDQPVSHIIHYQAIQHMKAQGLSWYYIGARCNKNEWMKPTDKEWQIGHFKEGFSTHSFFKLRVSQKL